MKKATEVFGEWAVKGKDKGMEKTHALPVGEMLDFILSKKKNKFTFLDLKSFFDHIILPLLISAFNINPSFDTRKINLF